MVAQKQIHRALKFARPVVAAHFDAHATRVILTKMRVQYQIFSSDLPQLKSPFNHVTLKIAVDTLALYRALRTNLALIPPFIDNWMEGQFDSWVARKVFAQPTLHRLYRRWWFGNVNRADEASGQRFELLPSDGDLFYGVNVTHCGIVRFFTRMGAPELAPLVCRGDFTIQKYLPPGVTFARSQVIAEGAPYCDFRYYITKDRGWFCSCI
ncbi:MAG: hypothetical protein GFH27_549279n429 [Chloroflexi bacterium AL-W]|nr:hypothetical protein [Chloroflexi bacterium AL-N1]NOK65395.1 hypothetical protein [Chloroflexi bacterium AL-N10]NOK72339.1 hypothetical protein [Chloroflexi bacterium AL-N5]NOK79574.1 hypothetical protein [Chloroflexi bacterium AL-W]NOK87490.1 hypothetical protein [Chloroflexi bacterium AL-N15]